MSVVFADRLRDLARRDAAVAPLALIQAEALQVSASPTWSAAVPPFSVEPPWLDGTTIRLDPDALASLLFQIGGDAPDPLPLFEASIAQDTQRFGLLVGESPRRPVEALIAIIHVATLPLLLACGAQARPRLEGLVWEHGYCPLCAAWPILLEVRGLERQRWLRCGRCGSGWQQINALCPFCGSDDYHGQTYLAPEAERETRQAQACAHCRGYFKVMTTLGPLEPAELLLRDLQSLELDVAALEQGYARPDHPARVLRVKVEPLASAVGGA